MGDSSAYADFRSSLVEAGLLVPLGVDGLYLRSEGFERIVRGVDALISELAAPEVEATYHLPMVVPREILHRTGYLRSFPQLAGVIASFTRTSVEYESYLKRFDAGDDVRVDFEQGELALCSAGCHPLYPTQTGILPEAGRTVEVFGQCFRHEPSIDPARMQAFRQHEVVYLGSPEGARAHRDRWVVLGLDLHERLGLKVEQVAANDPFFGRVGTLLAADQLADALKIEIVTPICSTEEPTAITSVNCHLDHFGQAYEILTKDGMIAHTACVGFGVERISLALLHTNGLNHSMWPSELRMELRL